MIYLRAMAHGLNESVDPMRNDFPRRIAAAHPPGSLLKRAIVQPRMRAEEVTGRDVAYLAMVRQLPCLKCGMEPSEAAHVRYACAAYGKKSGLQKKPEDRWALCLCADCHRLARDAQHKRCEQSFWHELGINPLAACVRLYAVRGDLVAMRAVVFLTISERGTR